MEKNNLGLIYVTLFFGMVLTVVPLPPTYMMWRPAWVPLLLIYWVMMMPHSVGIFTAWCVGLLLDDLEGGVLGQNALALSFVAFFTYALHLRMRVFLVWQQMIAVLVLVGVYQLIHVVIERAISQAAWDMSYWLSSLSSAAIWPALVLLLGQSRQRSLVE
ncbi:Rod shape-determining transmembrane protein [gamma proteobacterium HdN1]|nr:Rod shape-determining transmembrane protein [gamma proteobacterium HdN1]